MPVRGENGKGDDGMRMQNEADVRTDVASGSQRRERLCCVLVHGFNGEPLDMAELGDRLEAQGYAVRQVLLPGHGTTLRDFGARGWNEWLAAVVEATREALQRFDRVVLVGHSLGAALVLHVAAHEPGIAGVAALCPPLSLWPGLRVVVRLTYRVLPYVPSWREDVRDWRGARRRYPRRAYRFVALRAVEELYRGLPEVRASLPLVSCPALVLCARRDHVVPVRDGIEAYARLGSEQKELVVLQHAFHAVTKDVERELVFEQVLALCAKAGGAPNDTAGA